MSSDAWDDLAFHFGWLPCLITTFMEYYRPDEDGDPAATDEMLRECRWIYDRLMESIGRRPNPPPVPSPVDDPEIPF